MRLASGVHVAHFGDRAVILDVRANRYQLVGARHAAVFADLALGCASTDSEAERTLIRAGFLDPSGDRLVTCAHPAMPRNSALEMGPKSGSTLSGFGVVIATLEAVGRLKWTRFAVVLSWAASLKSRGQVVEAQTGTERLATAQAFDRYRMRIPLQRICLRDAVALFAYLIRNGHSCDLVLGVRLDPFEAHCWVQADDIVLSDRLDNVRQMRPILAL